MSLILDAQLDAIQLSQDRRPRWRIEIFDTRSSTGDTINDIVQGNTLEAITGPRDFTGDVATYQRVQVASDFAQTGVAVPSLTLSIPDPGDRTFDVVRNPTGLGRFLRRGNTIRIYQGDARIDPADWPATFTGRFVGQPGVDINRTTGSPFVTCQALGREADFINIPLTSDDYSAGETMNQIATDIALTDMGLDASELNFSNWGAQINGHNPLQFIELPPIVAIANLMMADGVMPRFDGNGILTETLGLTTQQPNRIYTSRRLIRTMVAPPTNDDPYNCVKVSGLANVQSEIVQGEQDLFRDLHVTVGFFSRNQKIKIYHSEDRTQLAKDVRLIVIQSVNSGLTALGGGETSDPIDAPIGTGSIGITITIQTGFAPYLLIYFGYIYVKQAAIPDAAIPGQTIPIGRVIQAFSLAVILILMTKIGKAQYGVRGKPFEFVYLELNGIAELPDLTTQTRKKLHVMNQTLQTQADVNTVARNMLDRQQALGSMRASEAMLDLKLEPDDVFQLPEAVTGSGVELYQIQSITDTGRRDESGAFSEVMKYTLSELTAVGKE